MSASPFLVERAGDIERWTLNDPATRNALSDAMVVGLYEAALRAQKDDSLRVVVLTGAGEKAFCTGDACDRAIFDLTRGDDHGAGSIGVIGIADIHRNTLFKDRCEGFLMQH